MAPKPTESPIAAGGGAPLPSGVASEAEAEAELSPPCAASGRHHHQLGRFRFGGRNDGGRIDGAQLGQQQLRRLCAWRCRIWRTPPDKGRRSIAAPCRSPRQFSCARMIKARPLARLCLNSWPRHKISPSVACDAACCFLAAMASQLTARPHVFVDAVAVQIEARQAGIAPRHCRNSSPHGGTDRRHRPGWTAAA